MKWFHEAVSKEKYKVCTFQPEHSGKAKYECCDDKDDIWWQEVEAMIFLKE